MTQANVERVIGRLVTDERFRRRFTTDRQQLIDELLAQGIALNACERRALAALDGRRLHGFAEAIHPCIQKAELSPDVESRPRRSTDSANDPRDPHARTDEILTPRNERRPVTSERNDR